MTKHARVLFLVLSCALAISTCRTVSSSGTSCLGARLKSRCVEGNKSFGFGTLSYVDSDGSSGSREYQIIQQQKEEKGQYLIRMEDPLPRGTLGKLKEMLPEGSLVQFVPESSYLLYAREQDLEELNHLEEVLSIFEIEPKDKVDPELAEILQLIEREQANRTGWWDGKISSREQEAILEQLVRGIALDDEKRLMLEVTVVTVSPEDLEHTLDKMEQIFSTEASPKANAMSVLYRPKKTEIFAPGSVAMGVGGARLVDVMIACWPTDAADIVVRLTSEGYVNYVEAKPRMKVTNEVSVGIIQGGSIANSFSLQVDHPIWEAGIRGKGQIAAIGDTGLDYDSCFFRDDTQSTPNPEHRKVIALRVFGDTVDSSGHGTHVSGSVLGSYEDSPHNGMAPDARLVFTDMGIGDPTDGRLLAPINGVFEYYEYAYTKGARIQSDSWGGNTNAYTSEARALDEYLWTRDDYLVVIAAGNSGGMSNVASTVTTPANSKNGLAVGASLGAGGRPVKTLETSVLRMEVAAPVSASGESFRMMASVIGPPVDTLIGEELAVALSIPEDGCDSLSISMEGKVALISRGNCQFAQKIRNAQAAGARAVIMSNNEQSGTGAFYVMGSDEDVSDIMIPSAAVPESTGRHFQALLKGSEEETETVLITFKAGAQIEDLPAWESIAEFSSFGPTVDGRIKPDVVAPGQNVVSAASDGLLYTNNCAVASLSGTSMATPLVGGAALLVRQYFTDGYYKDSEKNVIENPSGALIKAVLINGAVEMQGFTESGLPLEQTPSFRQGFGRVDVSNSIALPGRDLGMWVADRESVFTGDTDEFCIHMPETFKTGEVPVLSITLVWMDPPASSISAGPLLINDLDLEIDVPPGSAQPSYGTAVVPDRTNNVEKATVRTPEAGASYKVRVRGYSVRWEKSITVGQPYALVVTGPTGLVGSTDADFCPSNSRAKQEAAESLRDQVKQGAGMVDDALDQLASAWGVPEPMESEQDEQGKVGTGTDQDPCRCSTDGVSGGVETNRPLCAVHIEGELPFCYVANPSLCESATPSEAFVGASWRNCDVTEVEDGCSCSQDGFSGGVDTGESGCKQLMLDVNNDETYYCYVKDPTNCAEDQYNPSQAFEGAGWRTCEP